MYRTDIFLSTLSLFACILLMMSLFLSAKSYNSGSWIRRNHYENHRLLTPNFVLLVLCENITSLLVCLSVCLTYWNSVSLTEAAIVKRMDLYTLDLGPQQI